MENSIALPSGNDGTGTLDQSSRKRKLIATDAEAKFGNQFPYELNQQRGSFPLTGGQSHAHQSWLYPNNSLKSNSIGNQIQMDQRQCQNYSLQSQSSRNGYSYHSVTRNSPFLLSSQSSKHDSSLLSPMPARETPELLNSAAQDYSMLNRNELSEQVSLPISCNAHIGNSDIGRNDLVKYGINKLETPGLSLEIGKLSPESLRSVATVSISFPDGFNGRTCSEEVKNIGSAWESRISRQDSIIGNSNYPSELADNSRIPAVESGKQKPSQNVLKSGSASSGSAGENLGTKEQCQKGSNVDFLKQTETIGKEDIKQSCIDESIKDGGMLTKSTMHAHSIKQTSVSSKLLKEMLSPANATSSVPEKLWEGSLQLNSSVTASVVAFYKSGERLPDVNWSECVEVKGKVRLEAFEKYIQDLPRSRTRGLMVTSMCWKKGSAEKELKGMKEVAKGYRKCERVGFAKLSSNVDVYLCPPSDKIVTILAKHGFFNGLAAAEDKSEVFLGCVVWRKNQMPSEKKSENSDSLSEQIVKTCSSSVSSHAVVDCSSDHGSVNVIESKGVEVCKMSSVPPSGDFLPTTSVLTMASISAREANISVLDGDDDDDDLPEFDFKVACKMQPNRKKLFCAEDDDDMPEWLPPRHHVGPMPRPDNQSRGFLSFHGQLPNVKVPPPPPLPFQNASTGFTYTPDLQPPSGSYRPIPGNFRGWRPS